MNSSPATIYSDRQAPATIDLALIDTGNQKRDNHLRGPDLLDVRTQPTMTYRSIDRRRAGQGAVITAGRPSTTPCGRYREISGIVDVISQMRRLGIQPSPPHAWLPMTCADALPLDWIGRRLVHRTPSRFAPSGCRKHPPSYRTS